MLSSFSMKQQQIALSGADYKSDFHSLIQDLEQVMEAKAMHNMSHGLCADHSMP